MPYSPKGKTKGSFGYYYERTKDADKRLLRKQSLKVHNQWSRDIFITTFTKVKGQFGRKARDKEFNLLTFDQASAYKQISKLCRSKKLHKKILLSDSNWHLVLVAEISDKSTGIKTFEYRQTVRATFEDMLNIQLNAILGEFKFATFLGQKSDYIIDGDIRLFEFQVIQLLPNVATEISDIISE